MASAFLCDFLVVVGFLDEGIEPLQPDAGFRCLPRPSLSCLPRWRGRLPPFAPDYRTMEGPGHRSCAKAVNKTEANSGTVAPEHPIWVEFARSMAPMMAMPAELLAKYLNANENHASKILDLAAGHGLYGIAIARRNPNCEVWAVGLAQRFAGRGGKRSQGWRQRTLSHPARQRI